MLLTRSSHVPPVRFVHFRSRIWAAPAFFSGAAVRFVPPGSARRRPARRPAPRTRHRRRARPRPAGRSRVARGRWWPGSGLASRLGSQQVEKRLIAAAFASLFDVLVERRVRTGVRVHVLALPVAQRDLQATRASVVDLGANAFVMAG